MSSFFKQKGIWIGLFMMVFYQLLMIGLFMSGYSSVPKNLNELSVAVVNEDQQAGKALMKQMEEKLPFHLVTNLSLAQAKQELEERTTHLIVHIPKDFTEKLSKPGEQVKLDFLMNQSNPSLITSTMQNVANQIKDNFRTQLQNQSWNTVLQGMKVPEAQAEQMVSGVMNKLEANFIMSNPQPAGMHNQMAPMFLTMSAYVGAMIYSMMSIGALKQVQPSLGKWKAFWSLQGVNVMISLIAPLVGVSLYFAIHGYGVETYLKMWMVHSLEMLVSIEFTSVFCLLAGQAGMLLNLPILLTQTIANGSVIPQEMMAGWFKLISYISPMFYTVHLDYNLLFGGGKTSSYLLSLALVGLGALLINAVIHAFKASKQQQNVSDPAPQPLFM